jgi:serine/threonine protein kinase
VSTGAGLVLAGRYRLLDQVAVGAMGEVWRAHDDRLDRDVAVKVLRPELADDDAFLSRFRTEARHAASVRHPHVAAVHDYGEDPEVTTGGTATAYLVMELLDGRPLNQLLAATGPLPAERVAALLAQVADALAAAHRIGLVHRDIKPANLVVSPTREEDVTVTDFGIARAADAVPVTRTGLVMGTAEYLSPEQARGERATTASDVYSLGVVAYELLTGQPPFTGDNAAEVARAHVQEQVPPLPDDVPEAMRVTVARCLRKRPDERPDVAALADRLRALAEQAPTPDDAWWASGGSPEPVPGDPVGDPADPASGTTLPGGAPRSAHVPATPRTAPIPVAPAAAGQGGQGGQGRPGTPGRAPRRRRRPMRAPLVALLALVALLLLATVLQAAGLLGERAMGPDGGTLGVADAGRAAATDVTRSTWHTIDKDGR